MASDGSCRQGCLLGQVASWKSISTKRCSSSGLRSFRLSHPYDAVPYEVSGLKLWCSIPQRPKHYPWNQTESNPERSVCRCMPFYSSETLGVSRHISMASISLFLQEIFLQQNKHNIPSSLLQCVYKISFFKDGRNVISKGVEKSNECSAWDCSVSSWVSQGHASYISSYI